MEDTNLEQFNPIELELTSLAEENKDLKVNGIEDEVGYANVKEAKTKMQKVRTNLVKVAKEARKPGLQLQKGVIDLEKRLLAIVKPVEDYLGEQLKSIDSQKERLEREPLLPMRKEQLSSVGIKLSDDEILEMNEKQFAIFILEKKTDQACDEFLETQGYNEENKDNYLVKRDGASVVLYKKVAETTL